MSSIDTVVFDLGGVLVDWNPRHLYRKIMSSEAEVEDFLTNVCTNAWNEQHDAGKPIVEGTEELVRKFPEHEKMIRNYFDRWTEMFTGEIAGTVRILEEVKNSKRFKLYGLSNWSAETFPYARKTFPSLSLLEKILVSGEEKMIKPNPKFFALLTERFGVDPNRAVFIDDNLKNFEAAKNLGFHAIHFKSPEDLRQKLTDLKVLS